MDKSLKVGLSICVIENTKNMFRGKQKHMKRNRIMCFIKGDSFGVEVMLFEGRTTEEVHLAPLSKM